MEHKKNETGIHGKYYEREIILWTALQCLSNRAIKDFWILSNPEGPKKFDDLVLHIEYIENLKRKKELYFFQMKHRKETGVPFEIKFLEANKNFCLKSYEKDFLSRSEYEETFRRKHDIDDDVTTFYCIYTNLNKTDEKYDRLELESIQDGEINDVINTSNCCARNCIYKVKVNPNVEKKLCDQFLEKFYLWLNQINEADIEERIVQTFKINKVAVQSLIHYFERSFQPPTKDIRFTKSKMIRKMLEIFFENYQVPKLSLKQPKDSTNLLGLLKSYRITIIKEKYSEDKIWSEILEEIGSHQIIFCNTEGDKQTLHDTYLNLVHENKAPFFIKSSNPLFISFKEKFLDAICSYVVVYVDDKNKVVFNNNETEILEYITDLKNDNLPISSQNLPKLSLQRKSPLDLLKFVENYTKPNQKLDIDILFKYLGKTIEIGDMEMSPDYYITRRISVPILKLSDIDLNKRGANRCVQIFCKCSQEKGNKWGFEHLQDFFEGHIRSKKQYSLNFFYEHHFQMDLLYNFNWFRTRRNRHIHIFEMINGSDLCTPMYNKGFGECVTTEKISHWEVNDDTLPEFCQQNKVNIICNNAGQGKTMLLKHISTKFPSDTWVIYTNLSYYSSLSSLKDFNSFIEKIYNFEKINTRIEFHDVIDQIFNICKDKKNFIWLIDDYEEIESPQLKKILQAMYIAGIKIWITSRPFKKVELENIFRVNAMEMIHITEQEQISFFEKYFRDTNKNINVTGVLENIHSIRKRMDDTFIGVFQQMTMLAEIFKMRPFLSNNQYEIIDIYQMFTELKIQTYPLHHRNMMKIIMRKCAASIFFSDDTMKRFIDFEEYEAQIDFFRKEYQKGSIITHFTEENAPIFSHKTYAEYLTAKWLAEKIDHDACMKKSGTLEGSHSTRQWLKDILRILYTQKLRTVRYFFDAILTKHYPMLSAVVNKNYELMEDIFMTAPGEVFSKDVLGRTLLHFLISNEPQYDIQVDTNILINNTADDAFVNITGNAVSLTVPKTNYFCTDGYDKFALWFDRYFPPRKRKRSQSVDVDHQYERTKDQYLEINLKEFVILSGSLEFLNKLLAEKLLDLSFLEEKQKYLIMTHSIINGFNNILKTCDLDDLNIPSTYVTNYDSMSLLHLSISVNNWEAFKILFEIDNRLEKWKVDNNGNTILHVASKVDDKRFIDTLYQNGTFSTEFLNRINSKGQSSFHSLIESGVTNYVNEIVNTPGLDVEIACKMGNTPFITSIISGNLEVARILKKKKVNINHKNKKGYTALHYACINNNLKCAEQLILWNADINAKNTLGHTPLSLAVINDNKDVFRLLLRNNAKLNTCDKNGWTVLHHAIKRDNISLLTSLLIWGAKLCRKNNKRQTPLMIACYYNRLSAVHLLLQYEQHANLLDAYHYAEQHSSKDIIELINLYKTMFS